MKNYLIRFFALWIAVAVWSVGALAQDPTLAAAAGEKYVISAKAGGVNFVEGAVGIVRKQGTSGYLLKGDKLEIGDRVSTGADGKVEILLNPGSFVRLGGTSAFEFKTTSLDDLKLRLDSGSAILEVFAGDDFKVEVSTPKTKYLILETGIYRIDVLAGGGARLEVWNGSARVNGELNILKDGRVSQSDRRGKATLLKLDRGEKDALDIWSKSRGKDLAKVSGRLRRDALRGTLIQSFLGRRWNLYDSFGLWVYDPFYGGNCFLPFGYGWYSPYGYGYGQHIGWYNLPPIIYSPPTPGGGNNQPTTAPSGTDRDRTPGPTISVSDRDRSSIPPFIRIQQTVDRRGGGFGTHDAGGGSYNSGSAPSFTPSSSPPPSSSAPVKVDPATGSRQP